MSTQRPEAVTEVYQAVAMAITAAAMFVRAASRIYELWPVFVANLDTAMTAGITEAVRRERGH